MLYPSPSRLSRRWLHASVLVSLVVLLSACGGGGGSSSDGSSKSSTSSSSSSSVASSSSSSVADTAPDSFSFALTKDAEPESEQTSQPVTISGITAPVPVVVTGGSYRINGGEFTTEAGTVSDGDTLTVRATAAAELGASKDATVTVGEGASAQSATFSITTLTDTTAPQVTIHFPPPVSASADGQVFIRGVAEDDYSDIATLEIFVEGGPSTPVPVTSEDGYATWSATVPLTEGADHVIKLVAEDNEGNRDEAAAQVSVRQQAFSAAFPEEGVEWINLNNLTYDADAKRILIAETTDEPAPYARGRVISVDMETATQTVVSAYDGADEAPAYTSSDIVLDVPRKRALLVSYYDGSNKLFTLDLGTHERDLLFDFAELGEVGSAFGRATAFAIDPRNSNHLYMVSWYSNNLIRVDLANSEIKTISENTAEYAGPEFDGPSGIAIVGDQALVLNDLASTVFSVELASGNRSEFYNGTADYDADPRDFVGPLGEGLMYMADFAEGIMEVDLDDNTYTNIAPRLNFSGADLSLLEYMLDTRTLFRLETNTRGLYVVDPVSRTSVILAKPETE